MAEPFNQGDLKQAASSPEVTLEMYQRLPEDVCELIEVVDGRIVRCGSPTFAHQTIAHNLVSLLRDAVKDSDRANQECHRVAGDLNVRRRDFHALDTFDPFRLKVTWEQLDEGL